MSACCSMPCLRRDDLRFKENRMITIEESLRDSISRAFFETRVQSREAERGCRERCSLLGFGDCSHAPAVRGSAWLQSEIARSACAFAKRARLPQAEDSAPMRVSRIEAPSRFGRQPNVTPFQKEKCSFSAECGAFCN